MVGRMKLQRAFFLFTTLVCSSALLACGTPARELQSITVSPNAADVVGPTVQFTATGMWNTSPTMTTPLSARWGVCQDSAPTDGVTVTQTGLATCQKGAKGTYTVFADDPPTTGPVCNALTACGGGCYIVGSAQLSCP